MPKVVSPFVLFSLFLLILPVCGGDGGADVNVINSSSTAIGQTVSDYV